VLPYSTSEPLPVHQTLDELQLSNASYRDSIRLDALVAHARQRLRKRPHAELLGDQAIGAIDYGLPLRVIVFYGNVAINAQYVKCYSTDTDVGHVAVVDALCPDAPETILRPYDCIMAAFYDLDRHTRNITRLYRIEAHQFQHQVDRQMGLVRPCPLATAYTATCLYPQSIPVSGTRAAQSAQTRVAHILSLFVSRICHRPIANRLPPVCLPVAWRPGSAPVM
jgi:hypothetical protein